jgi:NhaP-type Na+/H+ or K+/H+ antiporter
MTEPLPVAFEPFTVAVMLVAGIGLGFAYFALMRRSTESYLAGGGWLAPLALTAARLAGAVVVLAVAAHFGAASLLAVFGGFLIARAIVLRRVRRESTG